MTDTALQDLEARCTRLEDAEALRALLDDYLSFWDHKQWSQMGGLLTPDVVLISAWSTLHGREAVMTEVAATLNAVPAMYHLLANLRLDTDGDTAEGTSNLWEVHLSRPDDPTSVDSMFGGRYRWSFVRTESGWRVSGIDYRLIWSTGPNTLQVFQRPS